MSANSRITNAYENAFCLPLNPSSKYVLFSDCHRGTGRSNDNFLKNEFLYVSALKYYMEQNFTYIELGDGDELWENRSLSDIQAAHEESFQLLSEFRQKNRFYAICGNHDISKRKELPSGIILEDQEQQTDPLSHPRPSGGFSQLCPLAGFTFPCPLSVASSGAAGSPDPTSAAQKQPKEKAGCKNGSRTGPDNIITC